MGLRRTSSRLTILAMVSLALTGGGRAPLLAPAAGDEMQVPLEGRTGDAAAGRRIVVDREVGNCLICHRVPDSEEPFQGDIGPDLSGVGTRLSAGQIRLRLVDMSRLNPATIMPPYHRTEGLNRVMARYRGRPVLDAQQIEDVVAYLQSLKD
jgi:sulfur-oxidizing protein SoxX